MIIKYLPVANSQRAQELVSYIRLERGGVDDCERMKGDEAGGGGGLSGREVGKK